MSIFDFIMIEYAISSYYIYLLQGPIIFYDEN